MEEGFHYFSKSIESIDKTRLDTDLSHLKNEQNKLHGRITRVEKRLWNELEDMQSEYRAGECFLKIYLFQRRLMVAFIHK